MSSDPQAGRRQLGPPVQVIGTDAGGLASLSAAALELVRGASLLAAPSRLQPGLEAQLAAWATQAAEATNPPAPAWKPPRLLASDKPEPLLAALQQALVAGESVVLLASGDPLWFGIGRLLLQHIPPERLHFHSAPTSLQLAFARLGRPWQDAGWVSLHGRDTEPLAQRLQQRPAALAVLTDPSRGGAEEVRRLLRASGLEAAYGLWLAERLGHPQERLLRLAPTAPLPSDLDPLHLVLLIAEPPAAPDPAGLPLFGLDDGLWLQHPDRPGLMTKREVRIQLLADLELPVAGVLWDLGAGVGSIGLEALRLRPQLQLWAVERRGGSAALIEANAERLGVRPAGVLEQEALEACAAGEERPSPLPDPDRVLIGGGGRGRAALLAAVLQRLRPGGVVVIPLATVEALAELRPELERGQLEVSVSQHQAWRGAPLADGTRLAPLNPVLVLKGRRSAAGA
ncbi:precorrin-6y C5,15-methyltransferase (decarboxylating) subunit CbiE [Synechococcus sp. ATX 2A4]|uniref:precorrin-6y C5,15-methyltransferase (decarboxylating) subunit CbiE n=1 Tax=Synechococcus sp. ATX 2A4 TaxID=2823727 RepID=UPI0020CD2FFA|nr:precorrin-6y C5,15-methyltransferase (decarboxylating) subunit CbiE [Synechococcus sp. ATX 2A4]MCP9884217.1 precorrin-6y C5,15-methyltransferase (decarboxylating) subunit CbiE [Synechococcus sp. ATX 2A4]